MTRSDYIKTILENSNEHDQKELELCSDSKLVAIYLELFPLQDQDLQFNRQQDDELEM